MPPGPAPVVRSVQRAQVVFELFRGKGSSDDRRTRIQVLPSGHYCWSSRRPLLRPSRREGPGGRALRPRGAPLSSGHMSDPTPAPPDAPAAATPVSEFERRLEWSAISTFVFIAILLALLGMGLSSLFMKPWHPVGLGDDPDVVAAAALLAGPASVTTNGLRWSAAALGGEVSDGAPGTDLTRRASAARQKFEAAHARHRRDPRPLAGIAALEMIAHDYAKAAGHYRRACEAAPRYGEGRLGAGVALALQADRTPETWQSRALRLQAIAEFAMVDSTLAEYPLATYNRALVLRDADRPADAAFWAGRYLARDGSSAWAENMRAIAGTPAR